MMQLNELDKKSLIELKDEIADLERRVEEVATITVKADTPLEVLLEQSSYKDVWAETYEEAEAQARELLTERGEKTRFSDGERLTYSSILESGKTYEQVGDGFIGLFALKIFEGRGLFEWGYFVRGKFYPVWKFTAIPEEKYVLFERGLVIPMDTRFEVKELEGHIQYVLAMSAFLDYEIKEVE